MKSININEIKKMGDINLIDVRETFEYENGSVKGAKNIPMTGLVMNSNNFLNKDEKYYIMCQAGSRSLQVCHELENQGYDVVNLEGGYGMYEE